MAYDRRSIYDAIMRNESIVPGTEFAPQREGFAPMLTTRSWPTPTYGQRYFGAVDPMAEPAPDDPYASTSRLSPPGGGSWGDVEGEAPIPYGGRPLAPWMSPRERAPGPPPDPFMRRPGFPGQQDMRLQDMDEFSSQAGGDTLSDTDRSIPNIGGRVRDIYRGGQSVGEYLLRGPNRYQSTQGYDESGFPEGFEDQGDQWTVGTPVPRQIGSRAWQQPAAAGAYDRNRFRNLTNDPMTGEPVETPWPEGGYPSTDERTPFEQSGGIAGLVRRGVGGLGDIARGVNRGWEDFTQPTEEEPIEPAAPTSVRTTSYRQPWSGGTAFPSRSYPTRGGYDEISDPIIDAPEEPAPTWGSRTTSWRSPSLSSQSFSRYPASSWSQPDFEHTTDVPDDWGGREQVTNWQGPRYGGGGGGYSAPSRYAPTRSYDEISDPIGEPDYSEVGPISGGSSRFSIDTGDTYATLAASERALAAVEAQGRAIDQNIANMRRAPAGSYLNSTGNLISDIPSTTYYQPAVASGGLNLWSGAPGTGLNYSWA